MNEPAADDAPDDNDLRALAWVHEELRRSLDAAHKALRRHLKEAADLRDSDLDRVDPAVLRQARAQLHQGVGALELIGLPVPALVLRASEAAVQRMSSRPELVTAGNVERIEHLSFALLDYLVRLLGSKAVSAVALFPQYRAALELAGADRIHPADLWSFQWRWRDLPDDPQARPREIDAASRTAMETLLLPLMRMPDKATLARMSDLCADLGAATQGKAATLWKLAAAFYQAQSAGLLRPDVYTKRVAPRLLAQARVGTQPADVSDRLAHDLLFFCARADALRPGAQVPRLAAVWQAYGLAADRPAYYGSVRLGRFDPAWIAQARKRVSAARDLWAAVAGGELLRLPQLADAFALVGESLHKLYPAGDRLARALQAAAVQTVQSDAAPSPTLAMEVATSVLYLEASLEDVDLDHPELADRVAHLADRIDEVGRGGDPGPLEPWMEELYRRVSDRQTMGSVVQELRASLSEVEKQIDQYFRDPTRRDVLIPVPGQLSAMRGVLSVLGLDHASQAVVRICAEVDELAQTEVDPDRAARAGTFERLADNLGALSFLIDMLAVQPQAAKSLFRYDPDSGSLHAVMGRSGRSVFGELDALRPSADLSDRTQQVAQAAADASVSDSVLGNNLGRLAEQALMAEERTLAETMTSAQAALAQTRDPAERRALRAELAQAIGDIVAPVAPPPATPAPAARDDEDMREVFIEEAREVVAGARDALDRLVHTAPTGDGGGTLESMTVVRRAFHTLKGSGRMVGLADFGEAAWACEQLYNSRLAQDAAMDPDLESFTTEAIGYLAGWVEALAAGRDDGHQAAAVRAAADALRNDGRRVPIGAPVAPGAPIVAAALPAPAPTEWPPAWQAAGEPGGGSGALEQPQIPAASGVSAEPLPLPAVEEGPWPEAGGEATEVLVGSFEGWPADFVPAAEPAAPTEVEAPHGLLAEPADASSGVPTQAGSTAEQTVPEPAAEHPAAQPAESRADAWGAWPSPPEPERATLATMVPGLPEASDLDLGPLAPVVAAPAPEVSFTLDLGDLEAPGEAALAPQIAGAQPLPEPMPGLMPDLMPEPMSELMPEAMPGPEAGPVPMAAAPAPEAVGEATVVLPVLEVPLPDVAPGAASAIDIALEEPQGAAPFELPGLPGERGEDQVKAIGDLRIDIAMFNIFLNEADELSRRLAVDIAEWATEPAGAPGEAAVVLAHSLAGCSATVGFADLSALARAFEHALMRSNEAGDVLEGEPALYDQACTEIRRLLHQFAAGFLRAPDPALLQRLLAHRAAPVGAVDDRAGATGGAADELPPAAPPAEVPEAGVGPQSHVLPDLVEPALPCEPAAAAEPGGEPGAALPGAIAWTALEPAPEPATLPRARADAFDDEDDIDVADQVDPDLFPIFADEAEDLLPQLQARMHDWLRRPSDANAAAACMRTLHTFKGGARLAGAMRLGEMAHRLETAIEHVLARGDLHAPDVEPLLGRVDSLRLAFDGLQGAAPMPLAAEPARLEPARPLTLVEAIEPVPPSGPPLEPLAAAAPGFPADGVPVADDLTVALPGDASPAWELPADASAERVPAGLPEALAGSPTEVPPESTAQAGPATATGIDWGRFAVDTTPVVLPDKPAPAAGGAVRVRAPLLDRLVNQAGEVSIARARIEGDVGQLKSALAELTENLERLRHQLRDIEVQSETQLSSRLEAAKAAAQQFDPLEMDRYTRVQELTRMMAESVNDVATVQRSLQRTLQSAEDELAAQARLTRALQDDLLRTRMVEFESLSDRLYRVVRQAAKETGKQVRLDIVGGSIEIDRGVLERMTGPFEHLLRNAVAHGVEAPATREAAGKDPAGEIRITLAQEGNEVGIEFRDDGAGLDLERIRQRGLALGLIGPDAQPDEAELADLIFHPGFSTASSVTELAGRGIGMDVVRSEVVAMGGRIETGSSRGQGSRFRLVLPLTTAVTQVVLLRCDAAVVAVPSTLVEVVRRATAEEVEQAYASGSFDTGDGRLPFFWLGALLQGSSRGLASGRALQVLVIRSAAQRVVLHVDEVVGKQEVVVKNLGPQLSRLPGLAGMTLLPSGAVAPIYNPVALAALYGQDALARQRAAAAMLAGSVGAAAAAQRAAAEVAPLVLVVDDSLTVRRVTQRMLAREGYRVALAKDGMEALERVTEEKPAVVLSDIEMPRMDGFDFVRNLRADARLADLPVIMITSRIAQKHRDYAAELGVDHYLGKPYSEEELLSLVARYARHVAAAQR
jgi:chemosensory pili system protein ChpA (sensor histidine kinase/response regulator)